MLFKGVIFGGGHLISTVSDIKEKFMFRILEASRLAVCQLIYLFCDSMCRVTSGIISELLNICVEK